MLQLPPTTMTFKQTEKVKAVAGRSKQICLNHKTIIEVYS